MYDQATGEFLGLDKQLACINLRGDNMECFFSYRYNDKKPKVLYSADKDIIPNAIISFCFKKHFDEIMNNTVRNFLVLFFFLLSITNWKEKINHHRDNVNLNLIDSSLDYLSSFSPNKEVGFQPDLLNSANAEVSGRAFRSNYFANL